MPIIFERIDDGQTVAISQELEGKHYRSKLAALINSSNMSVNASAGQDFGWRLDPEQQVIIEQWEEDPTMVDKVSQYTKVQLEYLGHPEFLDYLLHTQEAGVSPERTEIIKRRENQAAYEARVAALRAEKEPEAMPAFDPKKVMTLDEFMGEDEKPAPKPKATK